MSSSTDARIAIAPRRWHSPFVTRAARLKPSCFDVTDVEQTRQALERLHRAGPIQVLVNNAGIYDDAPMAGMTVTQWKRVIDVSLNGFFNVTQPLLLPMIRTRWGRIVTITSVSGLIGNRGQVNYAAAKAGIPWSDEGARAGAGFTAASR